MDNHLYLPGEGPKKKSRIKSFLFIFMAGIFLIPILELICAFGIRHFKINPAGGPKAHYKRSHTEYLATPWKDLIKNNEDRTLYERSPYFGFTFKRNTTDDVNNYGFRGEPFPIENTKKVFNVAILGGSVAESIAFYFKSNPKVKQKMKHLARVRGYEKIQFINLAIPSHKQPQSFYISSYFHEMFDMAISIEGFNESYMGDTQHYPTAYPVALDTLSFVGVKSIKDKRDVLWKVYQKMAKGTKLLLSLPSPFIHSSLIFSLWRLYELKHVKQIRSVASQIEKLNQVELRPFHSKKLTTQERANLRFETWHKFMLLQHQMLRASGKKMLTVIQPSLYMIGKKRPSVEEVYMLENNHDPAILLPSVYKKMSEQLSQLQKKNLKVFDFTNVFDDYDETAYIDMCHFTDGGLDHFSKKLYALVERYVPYCQGSCAESGVPL